MDPRNSSLEYTHSNGGEGLFNVPGVRHTCLENILIVYSEYVLCIMLNNKRVFWLDEVISN